MKNSAKDSIKKTKTARLKSLILLTLLCLSLCACGGNKTKTGTNITILPVENIPDDFLMGVDVTSLIAVEKSGGIFYDARGKKCDLLELLKDGGANSVRLRVWNDPYDEKGATYGGGIGDLNNAIEIGKRATKAGMKVLIDFHYSDFWADPNKQTAPKAWQNFSLQQKSEAIKTFTTESLQKLKDAGVNVTMVQVGNEINNGMCGEIYDEQVFTLVKAGADAVRSFDKNIQIVVHYTDPLSVDYLDYKASLLEKYQVDYDVLATSYYPYWHGDVKKLTMVLRKVANLYQKKVMVAETSYPFTDLDGDGYGNVVSHQSANQEFNYPFTVEGQAIAVRDVIEAVAKVKGAGIGVFYWEPAWIPAKKYDPSAANADEILAYNRDCWEKYGSGWASSAATGYDKEVKSKYNGGTWDNQAFFDFDGNVLESVNVFKYAKTGSKGSLAVVRIDEPFLEFAYGKQEKLPETVAVTYNDGSVKDEAVVWEEKQAAKVLNKPDFGEYKVLGKLNSGETTQCVVKVTASNYLVNGGFETGDTTGWTVENPNGKGTPKVDKNNQNAKEGLAYFTGWQEDNFDFVIWQKIENLSPGNYKCFASFEGTGIKVPGGTQFIVSINKKDGTSQNFTVDVAIPNTWKKFFRAEINDIIIDENVENVVVKADVKVDFDPATGANGAWFVMDDVNFLMTN